MRDLTHRALDTAAQLGATYADVRVVRRREESIAIKSGKVEGVASGESEGFGLRVLVDGAWGFAATEGSYSEQTLTPVGDGVEANAIEGDEHQRRSYPDADGGPFKAAGFEFVRGLNLADHAEGLGEEAVALLSAPQCPAGRFTVILDPSQLYMQVH